MAISAPPSPSPDMIEDFSVTFTNNSLACTGSNTADTRKKIAEEIMVNLRIKVIVDTNLSTLTRN